MDTRLDALGPDGWHEAAGRELRRSRRYLLALCAGMTESETEWFAAQAEATCVKWHLGHVALAERLRLATLVPSLRSAVPGQELSFGRHAMHDRKAQLPSWGEILGSLTAIRRVTEALLPAVDGPEVAEVYRQVVNADYEQARFIRRIRRELGRPDVPEPRGRLIGVDTDVEAPPVFHVVSWAPPRKLRRGAAEVVSLEDRRSERAQASMLRGHQLVGTGDLRGALKAFQEAAGFSVSADALTYQGWMHALLGDLERAEDLCLKAIEVDPEFGNPYNDIGTMRLQRKDVSAAIKWFERAKRARRYQPRHFPFMNLGKLYLSLGMPEKALREFEGALSFSPANEEARLAIEHIKRQIEGEG